MIQRAGPPGGVLHRSIPCLKWAAAVLLMGTLYSLLAATPPHRKKQREPVDYALITGSVFTPEGALVPHATVAVREVGGHHRHWDAGTDEMGEFFVRVPPGKADYVVEASASGFQPDRATVHVAADERETIFLHLTRKHK